MIFGTSHYNKTNEPGALLINGASKVVLHPSVAGTKPRVFNIALIFLKESVTFTKLMSPVCLQNANEIHESTKGKTVYAVGYGVDQSGSVSIYKKHMAMVVLDDVTCQKFYVQRHIAEAKRWELFLRPWKWIGDALQTRQATLRQDRRSVVSARDELHLQSL